MLSGCFDLSYVHNSLPCSVRHLNFLSIRAAVEDTTITYSLLILIVSFQLSPHFFFSCVGMHSSVIKMTEALVEGGKWFWISPVCFGGQFPICFYEKKKQNKNSRHLYLQTKLLYQSWKEKFFLKWVGFLRLYASRFISQLFEKGNGFIKVLKDQ